MCFLLYFSTFSFFIYFLIFVDFHTSMLSGLTIINLIIIFYCLTFKWYINWYFSFVYFLFNFYPLLTTFFSSKIINMVFKFQFIIHIYVISFNILYLLCLFLMLSIHIPDLLLFSSTLLSWRYFCISFMLWTNYSFALFATTISAI